MKGRVITKSIIAALTTAIILSGCTTVDPERQARNSNAANLKETVIKPATKTNEKVALDIVYSEAPPAVIYVETPVYIPESEKAKATPLVEGIKSVTESNKSGIILPSDYSHAARIYDYSGDQVYEVYTQPLRNTDIYMQPGELILDIPFISDSERWVLGAGTHRSGDLMAQHIYIKPKSDNLSATLIINTDRRVYHLLLKSYKDVYMPMVRWNYKLEEPNNTMMTLLKGNLGAYTTPNTRQNEATDEGGGVDPRYLSFDYIIRYPLFRKPKWLPRLIFDDGKKTYVVFNNRVLQQELPGVFENEKDVINYRVNGDVIIIDKLLETLTVKYKTESIQIEKKRK
jgi:type IV secretion system protein VirB9